MKRWVRNEAGFTLVELMVAVTLLAVVLALVTASFISVTDSIELSRDMAEATRYRSTLRRLFTDNLSSVAPNPDLGFLGTDDAGVFGPADSLEFVCLGASAGAKGLPGVTKFMSFSVREAEEIEDYPEPDEDREEAVLEVIERFMVQNTSFMGEEVEIETDEDSEMARYYPIHDIDIFYYDHESEEWIEDWDSTAIGYLPWAVQIKINFSRTRDELDAEYFAGIDPAESPDLEIIVPLPAGAGVVSEFTDLNHFRPISFVE